MEKTYSREYGGVSDKTGFLETINPEQDIIRIRDYLLGLHIDVIQDGNTRTVKSKRTNKPIFTDEYVMDLIMDLCSFLNYNIQISRFSEERIKQRIGKYMKALKNDLATHGDDHYISNETWVKIMRIHEAKQEHQLSGWETFGIKWEYNKPVNYDMVYLVKDYDEEADQVIKFYKMIATFSSIIEASFNKSHASKQAVSGMLINVIGEIRTESTTLREENAQKGMFPPLFGGSKKETTKMEDWN